MQNELEYVHKDYKTQYLGYNYTGLLIIDGIEVGNINDVNLKETCYGKDDEYSETHKLWVFQASNDKKTVKYASKEMSFGVYGFWRILD